MVFRQSRMAKTIKKTVLNAGIYDLCHEGHLALLRRMRKIADWLIIVIHDDESCFAIKDKIPVQDLEHRIRNLEITGLVDEIIVTKSKDPAKEFEDVIKHNKNLVYMRGDDLVKDFPGQWILEKYKVPIKFLKYTKGISSTQLRKQLWQ